MDIVHLVSDPSITGVVMAISEVDGDSAYDVFVKGAPQRYYEGQIFKETPPPAFNWIDLGAFQSNLTAYEINNPSAGNLYSLNSARIDFVPYQFRPALKMIKSDEPRILIADSVGVGKTIETGLIIKELDARSELNNVLIICPKPLVSERKWEMEMRRFDEDFIPVDGPTLRQIISDTHRDEEWPARFNKAIIPYSILDRRTYHGTGSKRTHSYGLESLDPPPHFDLVIVDEAHHIRNGSMEKENAFEYKCVRYFCEHAAAVVLLTATPLQTGDDDLYALLNLLRPDIVMDKEVFSLMARPNEYITRSASIVRGAGEGWQTLAADELRNVPRTQWGENVVARNPLYKDILSQLEKEALSREERVKLISDIESLHSFNTMLNRTRRKDIQDFCVRRPYTVQVPFTKRQAALHDELLYFEAAALAQLHNARSVAFMMSTIRRQAASCIFGLAPQIRDMVNRRFAQVIDDPDVDVEEMDISTTEAAALLKLAQNVVHMAENLPTEDPKFDAIIKIIEEKRQSANNKIIIFSTFRHTLNYLYQKLQALHYRVAQIDGSVNDDERRELRARFELDKDEGNALDILMFTEVGSEGLDYQFCDTMINYDLPWNPMRIEQRIGRIDRRGQKSEAVNIYNIITPDTVDADIYERCLLRIGVFARSIGECEEVLGSIGAQIEKIVTNTELTEKERREKLEQMADNEVRRMQEMNTLEDEQKSLFGFDLSNYSTSRDIREADSPWMSPQNIQRLVERYFKERLGEGQFIIGSSPLKQLRLGKDARTELLKDFRNLNQIRTGLKRRWENYLKGTNPHHSITFHPETATKEHRAFFITPMHPLVKQAARYFMDSDCSHVYLEHTSEHLPEGSYAFAIYAWDYAGIQHSFKVVPVCSNEAVSAEILSIIQESDSPQTKPAASTDAWKDLENIHYRMWRQEKERYVDQVQVLANYKLEVINSNYQNRVRNLERKIQEAEDERIRRMRQSELNSATENYEVKTREINQRKASADIHTRLIAQGIIDIRKG